MVRSQVDIREASKRIVQNLSRSYKHKMQAYMKESQVPPTLFELSCKNEQYREEAANELNEALTEFNQDFNIFSIAEIENKLDEELEKLFTSLRIENRRNMYEFQIRTVLGTHRTVIPY